MSFPNVLVFRYSIDKGNYLIVSVGPGADGEVLALAKDVNRFTNKRESPAEVSLSSGAALCVNAFTFYPFIGNTAYGKKVVCAAGFVLACSDDDIRYAVPAIIHYTPKVGYSVLGLRARQFMIDERKTIPRILSYAGTTEKDRARLMAKETRFGNETAGIGRVVWHVGVKQATGRGGEHTPTLDQRFSEDTALCASLDINPRIALWLRNLLSEYVKLVDIEHDEQYGAGSGKGGRNG